MITQKYKQGEHEIKIESAESLQDAQNNNFKEGEYTKFYVNGKLTDNYMAMIRFIVDEVRTNGNNPVPTGMDLMKQRTEMFEKQNEEINKHLNNIKNQYGEMGISQDIVDKVDEFIGKIDPTGMRVKK
jgi:mevalonate pyrophosphate decarboxylase